MVVSGQFPAIEQKNTLNSTSHNIIYSGENFLMKLLFLQQQKDARREQVIIE